MKISINSILGSARRINSQRESEEQTPGESRKEIRTDSINIESRINTRISSIQNELREIQSSLTRNQIINDGIKRLADDLSKGGMNKSRILDDARYENRAVLREYIGEDISTDILNERQNRINELINDDIVQLRRLEVEAENILASDIIKTDSIQDIMQSIGSSIVKGADLIDNISNLKADAVRRLIKG